MARRRFFVDEVLAGRAELFGDDAHRLARVLRIAPGQKFEISDNRTVFLAEVETARKDRVTFTILEPLAAAPSIVGITLVASLIRFERFEWLIEKATELGVETIVPAQAERSEKGLDSGAEKRLARWKKIAREASEQSRRVRMPDLRPPVPLSIALSIPGDFRYFLDEDAAASQLAAALPNAGRAEDRVALLAGPEGGWTGRERAAMLERRWQSVRIGATILKTETAAIAAIAVLIASWQKDLRIG